MHPMNESRYLPNFDPVFCLRVAKWGAAICVVLLAIAVCILALVNPTGSGCPAWTIYAENGQPMSLWLCVTLFTAAPTIWICFIVLRWKRFSQQIYDAATGTRTPFPIPKAVFDRNKPDPLTFPVDAVFVAVVVGWCLCCTAPLWLMLANCTNYLPRYSVHCAVAFLVAGSLAWDVIRSRA
jgi:hypothetical protein